MDKGNTSCMTYCGFFGAMVWRQACSSQLSYKCLFRNKVGLFVVILTFFCQFLAFFIRFLRTKVELVDLCRKQEKVLGGKTKFWMAF